MTRPSTSFVPHFAEPTSSRARGAAVGVGLRPACGRQGRSGECGLPAAGRVEEVRFFPLPNKPEIAFPGGPFRAPQRPRNHTRNRSKKRLRTSGKPPCFSVGYTGFAGGVVRDDSGSALEAFAGHGTRPTGH